MIDGQQIRINTSGCLDQCEHGPVMVIYPDNVWYAYNNEGDIDRIIDNHLRSGKIVADLILKKTRMTIYALSTANGVSGLAVIRISGHLALTALKTLSRKSNFSIS